MPKPLTQIQIVIPAGEIESAGTEVGIFPIVAIIMPEEWTPALATLQASVDGEEYFDVYAGNTEVTFNVVANSMHWIEPDKFRGVNFVKVCSGTGQNTIAQAAARTFRLVVEGVAPARKPARKARRHR